MGWALFAVGLTALACTAPAIVPIRHWALLFPAFAASWLGTGLAPFWLVLIPAALTALGATGGVPTWPGWLGLGLGGLALAGLLFQAVLSRRAAATFDRVLGALDGARQPRIRRRARWVLLPFWMPDRQVQRIGDIRYAPGDGRRHLLDVYRPRRGCDGAPVLLQIHGGAWISGAKRAQGRPLMGLLAAQGWVCVAPNYRLSPRVRHPEHLVDCKRALAWVRRHIAEYGGDPERIVVTGGSAGAHLASLLALTAGDPALQPGFEDADTAVAACVPMYGPYDLEEIFTGRGLGRPIAAWMGKLVTGTNPAGEPEAYRAASPIHRVRPGLPPFLVVHGTIDNLVPVTQARRFVAALRAAGTDVTYVELPGAPHAFDIFHSPWADAATAGIVRWLTFWHARAPANAGPHVGSATSGPTTMARTVPS